MMDAIISYLLNFILCLCCFSFTFLVVGVVYVNCRYRALTNCSLKNKHIVITGGSSGIGKSLGCEAVKRGAHVTIIARDKQKLVAAKNEIAKFANSCQRIYTYSLDVSSDYNKIEKVFGEIEQEGGPIFMLINCAGTSVPGKLEDTSISDIQKMFNLNCLGTIYPTRTVVEGMKSRNEGHIVIVASQAAMVGIFGFTSYCASKYAIRGFGEALNMEVKPYGIKVTVAYPPDTDTPGFAHEEKCKPKETKLISQSAGLFSPDDVALKIMNDSLAGYFTSSVGFEGFLTTVLCAGMSPFSSVFHLMLESFLMGLFRIIGAFYLVSFDRIVQKCINEKNSSKKAEVYTQIKDDTPFEAKSKSL